MTTFLFWLAIPLGFSGLPFGLFGFLLLPFAVVSLFNEFAASRDVLWLIFGLNAVTRLPFPLWFLGVFWQTIDPSEDNPRRASLLCAQVVTAVLSVGYLDVKGLIGAPNSSWLLTSYWFICLIQIWAAVFILIFSWIGSSPRRG